MSTFVWSYLYALDAQYNDEMLRLWYFHLREVAGYQGSIFLMTNLSGIDYPGLEVIPITDKFQKHQEVLLRSVLDHDKLPWANFDAGLCLDTDILAVNDITRLFATDDTLRTATSQLHVLHPRHAGFFYSKPGRLVRRLTSNHLPKEGVNTCTVSCKSSAREQTLGQWKELILEHMHKPLPPLGDQSFLNLGIYLNRIKCQPYEKNTVVHADWEKHPDASIWHFPCGSSRLKIMQGLSKLK